MNGTSLRRALVVGGLTLGCLAALAAQESPAARLEAIHEDLVALRFEKALAGIETLLGDPDIPEPDRAQALVLRSETHVALGDLAAAEKDYREILRVLPAYAPDVSLTPAKARERFERVRKEMIGRLVPHVEPAAAEIFVDGHAVVVDAEGGLPVLAGEHLVRAERAGFDPLEERVTVAAGREQGFELLLVPNARSVVLRTEPEGVEVAIDGIRVGRTERPRGPGVSSVAPAELSIDNIGLGEHVFELTKPCFRGERRRDLLTVDLLDAGPKRYDVVRMTPVRGALVVRGSPAGAGVLVDGEPAGALPLEPLDLCPGSHTLVVSHGGRRVWASIERVEAAAEHVVEIAPRPNVALVGASDWPPGYEGFARASRIEVGEVALVPRADARAWARIPLPSDTDLALARFAPLRAGGPDEIYLFSPILGIAERLDASPDLAHRSWTGPSWGMSVADSRVGGVARVVEVRGGGAAAAAGIRVGDRVIAAGGIEIHAAASLRRIFEVASPAAPLELRWLRADGTKGQAGVRAATSPRLGTEPPAAVEAIVRAAWAAVDGAVLPADEAAPALANLALLLAAFDRPERAVEVWSRVRFGLRPGVGAGTASYHRGIALLDAGREREALAALREAAASQATAFDDDGPPVAPAARDHLADAGIATER